VSKLIETRANTGENKVVRIQYMVSVVGQLFLDAHALPDLFSPIGSRLGC
jgi:hypothetical protein